MAVVFSLVTDLLAAVGVLGCGLGVLVTVPWSILSLIVLYREFFIAAPAESSLVRDPLVPPTMDPPAPPADE